MSLLSNSELPPVVVITLLGNVVHNETSPAFAVEVCVTVGASDNEVGTAETRPYSELDVYVVVKETRLSSGEGPLAKDKHT